MKRPIVFIALGMLLAFGIMATILVSASLASADTHLRVVANSDIQVSLAENDEQATLAPAGQAAQERDANQTPADDAKYPGAALIRKLDEERRGGLRHVLEAFGGTAQSPVDPDETTLPDEATDAMTATAPATRSPTATRRPPAPTRTAEPTVTSEPTALPSSTIARPTRTPRPQPPAPTARPAQPTVPAIQPTSADHGDGENHGTPQPGEPTQVREPEPTEARQVEPTEARKAEATEVHESKPTEQHHEKTPKPHD